jgi:hypothetical protein
MPNPRALPTITLEDVTLRDIVEQRYDLVFQCTGCLKTSKMDVLELIHKFGPEAKLEPIRFKLRCAGCGRRRARPFLCNKTYPGDHAWWPWPPDGHKR